MALLDSNLCEEKERLTCLNVSDRTSQGRAAARAALSPECCISIPTPPVRESRFILRRIKKYALFLFSGKILSSFYSLARRSGLLGVEGSFCLRMGKSVNSSSHSCLHVPF